MVTILKSLTSKIPGKLCHFQKEDLYRHGLGDYYWRELSNEDIEVLKSKISDILKKEGFIFFDKIDYKLVLKFKKLHEFCVNYHHIN